MTFGSQAWSARHVEVLPARTTAWQAIKLFAAGMLLAGMGMLLGLAVLQGFKGLVLAALGIFLLLPFGLFLLYAAVIQYFGDMPTLLLDAEGLRHRLVGNIRWRDVLAVQLSESGSQSARVPVLSLGLVPGARVEGGWRGRLGFPQKRVLRIVLQGLDRTPAEIEAAAKALRAHIEPPALEAWHPYMSAEMVEALWENQRITRAMDQLMAGRPNPTPAEAEQMNALLVEMSVNMERLKREYERENRRFGINPGSRPSG